MTIWKYPFEIDDQVLINIPATHYPLTVQVQDGKPILWAMVDPNSGVVEKELFVYETGQAINPANKIHIGTIQMEDAVWHVFTGTK